MEESMKILYFLLILVLRFIVIQTQGQDQTAIDVIQITANDVNSVITTPATTSIPITLITDIAISSYTESTINGTATVKKKATTVTFPPPIYARPTPPLNPTWIIIGGFAGGLTALGLLSVIGGVYICYENSRRRVESSSDISTDQDNIPLYTVSSF